MSGIDFRYARGGISLPDLNLWLDAHNARRAPERVFVSHAHADHIARHEEVLVSAPTARFIDARLGGKRRVRVLPWFKPLALEGTDRDGEITLLPAGHILGSAMAWIRREETSLLYTGDFKLRAGAAAERCSPRKADVLIMETTFGRPAYEFPPEEEVFAGIREFCAEALASNETPVLLGYSLGKSQEILLGLSGSDLPISLHPQVLKIVEIYAALGTRFPDYQRFDPDTAKGRVVLSPPNADLGAFHSVYRTRTAIVTGWAVDPSARYRHGVDAAFALSDHSGFKELLEFVDQVSPRKVYTLHGFAADFAQTLRERGFDAQALSEPEQLGLLLGDSSGAARAVADHRIGKASSIPPASSQEESTDSVANQREQGPDGFSRFARTCLALGRTRSRQTKKLILTDYLSSLPEGSLGTTTIWFSGRSSAEVEGKEESRLGWKLLRDAVCEATESSAFTFQQRYLAHGDEATTAAILCGRQSSSGSPPTLAEVSRSLSALHGARGNVRRRRELATLLRRLGPMEMRVMIKILTRKLRIGLDLRLIHEALAAAFESSLEAVRRADAILNHLGKVAELARRSELHLASPSPFHPIKSTVAVSKKGAETAREALAKEGDQASPHSYWAEWRYEGVRAQLHKHGDRVALYSQAGKDISASFGELLAAARAFSWDFMCDGVLTAAGEGWRVDPRKRLRRRDPSPCLWDDLPVKYIVFDLLWRDGVSWLDQPLRQRREALCEMIDSDGGGGIARRHLQVAELREVASLSQLTAVAKEARDRGHSGLILKDTNSGCLPNERSSIWLEVACSEVDAGSDTDGGAIR